MSRWVVDVIVIFILLLINGVLAMSEIAVISARTFRLQQWVREGDKRAKKALELAGAPGPFLSTVQAGITLVSILAGAFGGATLAEKLARLLENVPLLSPYAHAIGLGTVVLGVTLFSLVLGELAPKRLGLAHAEPIARAMAYPMAFFAKLIAPAVWLLNLASGAILRLLRVKPSNAPPVTEEELIILLEQGMKAGIFEAAERDMVAGVLRLGNRTAADLMTPRGNVSWLELDSPPRQILALLRKTGFSRIPVARGSLEKVVGVVKAKDLLVQCLSDRPPNLKACLKQPLFIPESTPVLKLLPRLKAWPVHLAMVVDEYGSLQGILSLGDVLDGVAGAVSAAKAVVDPSVVLREDGSLLLDAMLPVDEAKEAMGVRRLPGEDRGYFHTLAGFVIMSLGRVPKSGDRFSWGEMVFEVVDMDGLRVDKILVSRVAPGEGNSGGRGKGPEGPARV